ncbi:tail protein X [Neomegalonema sp.]|uniref:tail protein X n=1 Tax=Neomegalonema sp. TaxID=2039713 RepID=UPI0026027B39|nr:tail protein X [Neomegalonema sp.]MDD2870078.1 tail protein X [Neomegalonema sp.]
MAEYVEHLTSEGDRWDLLAWTYYGDAHLYEPIVTANPGVPIRPFLEAGVLLLVPVLPDAVVVDQGLPPWKRRGS